MPSQSIVVRVRRTRVDEIHIAVPITNDLLRTDEQGQTRLDVPLVFDEAVRMARAEGLPWRADGEAAIEVHPIQTPP